MYSHKQIVHQSELILNAHIDELTIKVPCAECKNSATLFATITP